LYTKDASIRKYTQIFIRNLLILEMKSLLLLKIMQLEVCE